MGKKSPKAHFRHSHETGNSIPPWAGWTPAFLRGMALPAFYESIKKNLTMKKVLTLFIINFIVGVALEGLGLTAQKAPSQQKIIPLAQKKNPAIPPTIPPPAPLSLPEMSTQTAPLYNPTGKADPFLPTRVSIETKSKGKKALPLEKFEVNDFELVGIISGSGINKAMVQDLTGKGYFIQVGTSIGKMGGKVTRISGKEVVISEPYQDFLGRKKSRDITLKLPQAKFGIP